MNHMARFGLLFLCLIVSVAAAQAQGTCTTETMTGTYAFMVRGASTAISNPSDPPWILHWDAKYAPLGLVGMVTIQKNGTGEGFWWQINGTANGGLTPIPFSLTIPELNADCTGVFEYSFTFAGQAHTNREWFVLLDNGREFRGISQAGGLPTGTWRTIAYRVSNGVAPVTTFGQKNMRGDYLLSCEGLEPLPVDQPPSIFASIGFSRIHISSNGDFTGIAHSKIGPVVTPPAGFHVAGHFTVNQDGTIEGRLNIGEIAGVTSVAKGVLFDEGKRGFGIPLLNVVEGGPSIPQIYGLCEITRIGP